MRYSMECTGDHGSLPGDGGSCPRSLLSLCAVSSQLMKATPPPPPAPGRTECTRDAAVFPFSAAPTATMDTEELPSVDATVASGTAARPTADDAPDTAKELDRRQQATEEATAPAPHDNDGTLGDWSEELPPWGTDDAGGTAPTHSPGVSPAQCTE
ncbi:uncharacterized protein LOC124805531 [Schistocerca piceifrons]|uniref:uncharacterized protein LOC124805531 n=1 Tax=Schistocerca piceifrons TaxID=274613 RepID=UPI001F5FA728|nr:uncharacterized protein LOC124805531 [Schistocerca piceifrons]